MNIIPALTHHPKMLKFTRAQTNQCKGKKKFVYGRSCHMFNCMSKE